MHRSCFLFLVLSYLRLGRRDTGEICRLLRHGLLRFCNGSRKCEPLAGFQRTRTITNCPMAAIPRRQFTFRLGDEKVKLLRFQLEQDLGSCHSLNATWCHQYQFSQDTPPPPKNRRLPPLLRTTPGETRPSHAKTSYPLWHLWVWGRHYNWCLCPISKFVFSSDPNLDLFRHCATRHDCRYIKTNKLWITTDNCPL